MIKLTNILKETIKLNSLEEVSEIDENIFGGEKPPTNEEVYRKGKMISRIGVKKPYKGYKMLYKDKFYFILFNNALGVINKSQPAREIRALEEAIKLNPIATNVSIFPKKYLDDLLELADSFGEGNSFDLYKPMSETYDEKYFIDDDKKTKSLFNILQNVPQGIYITNETHGLSGIKFIDNNDSDSKFKTRIEVGLDFINVSEPYITYDDGVFFVGWFDRRGKYIPDTTHFNKDGNII